MKKTIFLLIFLSTLISNAQLKEKFEKGWINNNNNNAKIEGYIKTDDLSKLSSEVCFKRNLEEKKCQNYDNSKIKYFQMVDGGIFELLSLKINNNQSDIDVFANLILKGEKLSLYRCIYKSELFYILSKDDKNYVLQNDKFTSGDREIKKYRFKGILNYVTEGLILKNNLNTEFDENNIVEIVTEYNNSKKAQSKDLRSKEKYTNYVITNVGLGFKNNGSEYYGQIMYRKYIPQISRSTSINIGINYFNYQFKEQNKDFTQSLLSIPLQIQQNILNKNIRPYFFTGISLNYLQIKDENNNSILSEGLQKTYGINFLYGAGIEIDIFKGIYLKSEYRNEGYSHPIVFGIGYIFKNN
jgi:hypothetical protein